MHLGCPPVFDLPQSHESAEFTGAAIERGWG